MRKYTYSNNEDCTFTIQPSTFYRTGYFLEVYWYSFKVNGEMPTCSQDYVEVFLTRCVLHSLRVWQVLYKVFVGQRVF